MKGWAVLKSVLTHSVCFNLLSSCEKRAWQPEPHSLAGESNLDQRLHGLPKASAAKVSQGRAPRTPGSQFGAVLTPLPLLDFVGDFIKQKRGKKKITHHELPLQTLSVQREPWWGATSHGQPRASRRQEVRAALNSRLPGKVGLRSWIRAKVSRYSGG